MSLVFVCVLKRGFVGGEVLCAVCLRVWRLFVPLVRRQRFGEVRLRHVWLDETGLRGRVDTCHASSDKFFVVPAWCACLDDVVPE